MHIHNATVFTEETIRAMRSLGTMRNNWRQRTVEMFQAPDDPDSILTIGTSFDGHRRVITREPRRAYTIALAYAARGKVYVYD